MMLRSLARARVLLIPILVSAIGCTGDQWWAGEPELEWSGEHLTIYGYGVDDSDACAGTFEYGDRFVGELAGIYGLDGVDIVQHWAASALWAQANPCTDGREVENTAACTIDGEAWGPSLPFRHELVHGLNYRALGGRYCAQPLEEGLAVYFGHSYGDADPGFLQTIDELLGDAANFGAGSYNRAGHFVAFLVETYGLPLVLELCESVPSNYIRSDWDVSTQAVLGVALDQVLATYSGYPSCTQPQYRARLLECQGEPDVIVSTSLSDPPDMLPVTLSCDRADIIGTTGMTTTRLLQIDEAGQYAIDVTAGVEVFLEECVPCSMLPIVGSGSVYILRPGRYTIRLYDSQTLPRDAEIRARCLSCAP